MSAVTTVQWNLTGSIIAFGGTQRFQDGKELCAVQFYNAFGQVNSFNKSHRMKQHLVITKFSKFTTPLLSPAPTHPQGAWSLFEHSDMGGQWSKGSSGCWLLHLLCQHPPQLPVGLLLQHSSLCLSQAGQSGALCHLLELLIW